jgi:hypothetical protein
MQSALLDALIQLGILLRLAVILRCVVRRQIWRYFFFCIMLTFFAFGAAFSQAAALHRVPVAAYGTFYFHTRWVEAACIAAGAVEAFWGLARHFRNIRGFGWALIAVIVSVSAAAAGVIEIYRPAWNGDMRLPALIGQFVNVALALTALLSVAFFRQFRTTPVRPNAILHVRVLGLLFAFSATGYFVGQASHGQLPFTASLLLDAGPVVAYIWWLVAMKPTGDVLPFAPHIMSAEEYEAAEAEHKKTADRLKQAGSEALRKTLDPPQKPKRDWRFWRRR